MNLISSTSEPTQHPMSYILYFLLQLSIYLQTLVNQKKKKNTNNLQKEKEKVSFSVEEDVFTPQPKATALASFTHNHPLQPLTLHPWPPFISLTLSPHPPFPSSYSSFFSSNPSSLFHLPPFPFLGFMEIHSLNSMLLCTAMRLLSAAEEVTVLSNSPVPVLEESYTRNPSSFFEVNRGD